MSQWIFTIESPEMNPRFVWVPIESGPWEIVNDETDGTGKRVVTVTNGDITVPLAQGPTVSNP